MKKRKDERCRARTYNLWQSPDQIFDRTEDQRATIAPIVRCCKPLWERNYE